MTSKDAGRRESPSDGPATKRVRVGSDRQSGWVVLDPGFLLIRVAVHAVGWSLAIVVVILANRLIN